MLDIPPAPNIPSRTLWKTAVPGQGNSSPIVWGDRIFLTTAYDGGQRRSLLAFKRAGGEPLWETFAPATAPESAHRKNGHASSTPTTDGHRVYAYFGNHGLLAAGRNLAEAFYHHYTLESACKVQVDVLASGQSYVVPDAAVIDEQAREGLPPADGPHRHSTLAWEAVLRLLDDKDPSFRD